MFEFHRDTDRGVSIAITHVLTLGITAILISGLLISSATLLDAQQDRSAEQSLETIGERLAGELSSVERLGADGESDTTVRLTVEHPSMVASQRYTVSLHDSCGEAPLITEDTGCLQLATNDGDVDVYVPLTADEIGGESEVSGGTITIIYDEDGLSLEEGR